MKPRTAVFASVAVSTFAASVSAQQAVIQSGPGRTPISQGEWIPLTIQALGDISLPVVRDPLSGQEKSQYYVAPYFHYDIEGFRNNVNAACKNESDVGKIVSADLSFQFATTRVNDEISRQIIQRKYDSSSDAPLLRPYPYGLLQIYTGYYFSDDNVPGKPRWSTPPNAYEAIAGGYLAVPAAFDFITHTIPIHDTCDQLQAIAKGHGDFQAAAFSNMPDTKRNFFFISYDLFATSQAVDDIVKTETSSGIVSVSSRGSSGAVGLNVGALTAGGTVGSQKATNNDTRRRAVTANVLEAAVQQASGTIIAKRLREYNVNDSSINEVEKQLLDTLINKLVPSVTAAFDKAGDQQYKLRGDIISEVVLTRGDVNMLLKSSEKPELNGTQDVSGGFKGMEGSEKKATTVRDERGIEWKREGNEWIPTNVKLHVLSKADLRNKLTTSFEDIAVAGSQSVQKMNLQNVSSTLLPARKVVRVVIEGDPITAYSGGKGEPNSGCPDRAEKSCVRPKHGGKIVPGTGAPK